MPKTFPISIEVEEIALGSVLRRLNEMPGVVKLDLNLGRGGEGVGKKQLEHQAAQVHGNKQHYEATVVKLLMQGPKHIQEISAAIGGKVNRAYNVMTSLKKQGLTERGTEPATHQLTKGAAARLKGNGHSNGAAKPLALPAPATVTHGPSGRASPGSGTIVLRAALNDGALTPSNLRAKLVMSGISAKSASGVLERAKRDGIIKKNGLGYELTAKGQKIELGAPANG